MPVEEVKGRADHSQGQDAVGRSPHDVVAVRRDEDVARQKVALCRRRQVSFHLVSVKYRGVRVSEPLNFLFPQSH